MTNTITQDVRHEFVARFASLPEAVAFEDAALSVGDEFIPEHVRIIRDGSAPQHLYSLYWRLYWRWLIIQHEASQRVDF